MTMPFYVSPEQLMKDRADFARKGIARGRSVVVIQYADGILFVSENPSQALHKVSEIYDRIAFAAVGRYNEFENLRIAGVRLADMRGYAYDRRDVTGRGLANAYAQTLGTIFSSGGEKPYEVEIFVAEIGDVAADDQLYRLTYDGQVADEHGFALMGGAADVVAGHLREHYVADSSHARFVKLEGLRFKTWRMRPGEWFEGCYVFVDAAARAAFQETFTADAADSPGSKIIGSAPVLIEECEVVAVAGGPEGFVSVPSYDRPVGG